MKHDISRQTLIVLAVLTVMISLIGTFTVMHEVKLRNQSAQIYEGTGTGQGTITLKIVNNEPQVSDASGSVSLIIDNPDYASGVLEE